MSVMMTIRRWSLLIMLSIMLVLTLTLAGKRASGEEAARIKVVYGHSIPIINASYAPLAVAQGLGFFAKEGLDVTVQTTGGSLNVVQNIISGQFDIGVALPEAAVPAILAGHDIVMVYNFIRAPTGSVAVLEESPIKSLKDLKGKIIGAQSLGTGNIVLTDAMLAEAGLDPKRDVTYVAVGVGAQALYALKSGRVDALALFDSLYAGMENLGAMFRYFNPDPNLFSSQFVVKRETMSKRPKLIEGFGRAMAKATYFTELNPEAAIHIMWRTFPTTRAVGRPEAQQLAADMRVLKRRMPLLLSGGVSEHMRWGVYDAKSIDKWINFAFDAGIIKTKPDAHTLYSNKFVDAYNNWNPTSIQELSKRAK
jgi:NitT/TauT family transport system substrate-binding protein